MQLGEAVTDVRKSSKAHAQKRISDNSEPTVPIMNRRNK